ncbi:lysine-specific histone demethylase-like protein, partial [Trifolium pratense]
GPFLSEASRIYQLTHVQEAHPKKSLSKNIGQSTNVLLNLFQRPDLEFGIFAFVFDLSTEDFQSKAILQMTFHGTEEHYNEILYFFPDTIKLPLKLYTIISREQVYQMQEMTGDENRLSYLTKNLGLKLMGINALLIADYKEAWPVTVKPSSNNGCNKPLHCNRNVVGQGWLVLLGIALLKPPVVCLIDVACRKLFGNGRDETVIPELTPNHARVLIPFYKDLELLCVEERRFGSVIKCKNRFTNSQEFTHS